MSRLVRRAYGVVAVFDGAALELVAPSTRSRVPASRAVVASLGACESWTPVETVPIGEDGVEYLLRVGLLVERDTPAAARDEAVRALAPLGQETISHHLGARRQFVDHPVAQTEEEALWAIRGPQPPIAKTYPDAPRVVLPPPCSFRSDFEATVRRRRTWRSFSDEPLGIDAFSTLLGLVFGATGRVDAAPFGEVILRTSPSAGARHPVEAYVCALNVEGIDEGVYHYAVLEHQLERLEPTVSVRSIVGWLSQENFGEAAFVCLLTAVVERSLWKYPFGRTYRTMLLDVGHIAQTFTLTATALGLASFQTAAFLDPPMEEALGLDQAAEPLLHAVGAGLPPAAGMVDGGPAMSAVSELPPGV